MVGETGSGKTTQIPQYLHEAGYSRLGKVNFGWHLFFLIGPVDVMAHVGMIFASLVPFFRLDALSRGASLRCQLLLV